MNKTIKRILLAGLMGLTINVMALDLKPDAPSRYIVKKGDTLWGISEKFTDDPWQWPEIWYQNSQIENPHLIFPGDELGLVTVNGKKRLTVVTRGEASRTVKLQPTARIEPIESAIPAIPQDAIRSFLRYHRIGSASDLENSPHILAGKDARLMLGSGDKVYAQGNLKEGEIPQAYGIYRRGKVYKDPKTKEVLGIEAVEVGQARTVKLHDNILELLIESSNQQIKAGDLLLPTEDRNLVANYYPKAPSQEVDGNIMAVSEGVTYIGQYHVVALNVGLRDNVDVGTVLVVNKQGAVIKDRTTGKKVRLPDQSAGKLMVFRTFEKMSYGLIMSATEPLRVGDKVVNPY